MRVALVGWDVDDEVAASMARLSARVIVWTRWFPDRPHEESHGTWVKRRCPHGLGGGELAEALSFRDSVLSRLAADGPGAFGGVDVIHALDPMARPCAQALAERNLASLQVGSLRLEDVWPRAEAGPALAPSPAPEPWVPDCWIASHPWIADRWQAQGGAASSVPLHVVGDSNLLARRSGEAMTGHSADGILMAVWVPRAAELDVMTVAEAMADVRAAEPRFAAVVLGSGPCAEALRRRLAGSRVLLRSVRSPTDGSLDAWASWMASARVVGLCGPSPADDPAALAAWSHGTSVVALGRGNGSPGALAAAVLSVIHDRDRAEREVGAGAALAARTFAPDEVAAGWLRAYLHARLAPEAASAPDPIAPASLDGGRTRLTLVPVGPRELYASWRVRADERAAALDWLGVEATRATLALRLFDITDMSFDGRNAHFTWDVDLGWTEPFRSVPLEHAGRSVAATLGLRSPRGAFHPLAHAGPTHLPRESPTQQPPSHQLHALSRWSRR